MQLIYRQLKLDYKNVTEKNYVNERKDNGKKKVKQKRNKCKQKTRRRQEYVNKVKREKIRKGENEINRLTESCGTYD